MKGGSTSGIGVDGRPRARRATSRPAHRDEIPAVLELWRAETVAGAADSENALGELCAFQPGALLRAEQDGALVGTVIAAWDGWRGNLYRLAVRSSHRRRGIGSALVRAAESHLREQGATRISALVFDADEAIALAEATGAARDHRQLRFVKAIERKEGVQSHARDR